MKIGKNLKMIRENHRYTQFFLAFKLGVSQSTYSKIETDNQSLTLEMLEKISQVYQVPLTTLLYYNSSSAEQKAC